MSSTADDNIEIVEVSLDDELNQPNEKCKPVARPKSNVLGKLKALKTEPKVVKPKPKPKKKYMTQEEVDIAISKALESKQQAKIDTPSPIASNEIVEAPNKPNKIKKSMSLFGEAKPSLKEKEKKKIMSLFNSV